MSTCLRNLGKYKLQECIGRVGRVETWKAVDPPSRRYVTIFHDDQEQQNDPHFISRFEREAKVIRTLHHPNIVSICDVHTARPPESESTIGYLVMDFIEGVPLADYMQNIPHTENPPSPGDFFHFLRAVSSAIDYPKKKGVFRGNIKPANILLNKWS